MKLKSVKAPVWNGCWVKVRDQNYNQVGPKVMDQVRAYVEDQIIHPSMLLYNDNTLGIGGDVGFDTRNKVSWMVYGMTWHRFWHQLTIMVRK